MTGLRALYLDMGKDPPTSAELKRLLLELNNDNQIELSTKKFFLELSLLHPSVRLARNLSSVLLMMSKVPIYHILEDGLSSEEYFALAEVDNGNFTYEAKVTARWLLSIKERACQARAMRGYFARSRKDTEGYLTLE